MTVILLACSVLQTPYSPALNEAYWLLRAWEAKFEKSVLRISQTPNGSPPTSIALTNWPGRYQLRIGKTNRTLMAMSDGVAWYFTEGNPKVSWTCYSGSELNEDIRWVESSLLQPLQDLGAVLAGSTRLSTALREAKSHSVTEAKPGVLSLSFVPSPDLGLTGVSLFVSLNRGTGDLQSWSLRGARHGQRYLIGAPKNGLWEARVQVARKDGWQTVRTTSVMAKQPLADPPPAFVPPVGTSYLDAATDTFCVVGQEEMSPLDPVLAEETMRHASANTDLSSKPISSSEFRRCAPDALYYLMRAKGMTPQTAKLLRLFGDLRQGSNLSMISRVAKQNGLVPKAVLVKDLSLSQLKLPAILLIRPSHFVVVTQVQGPVATTISPPYNVKREDTAALRKSWTGKALWIE